MAFHERTVRAPVVDLACGSGDLGGERQPQLASAQQRSVVRREGRADQLVRHRAGQHVRHGRHGRSPLRMPDHDAIRAAVSLLAMPPLPRPLPPPTGSDRQQRVVGRHERDQLARRCRVRGSAVNTPSVSVSSTRTSAPHAVGDQGGDAIVVAVAQLVVGDRVVLVDDGHAPELEQPVEACCGRGDTGTRSTKSWGSSRTWAPTRPNAARSRL